MSVAIAWLTGCVLGFVSSIPAAGPLALLIVASGLERDTRRGVRLAIGGAVAESLYALLAFFGLGAILPRSPAVLPIARTIAGALILAVGVTMVRPRPTHAEAPTPPSGSALLLGFSIIALNPAFLITWVGLAAAISGVSWLRSAAGHPIGLAIGAFFGIVGWFMVLLGIARRSQSKIAPRTLAQTIRALGVVLLGIGAWLAIDAIRRLLAS